MSASTSTTLKTRLRITAFLKQEYGIDAVVRRKMKCPFCGKSTFSIEENDLLGKCFHPGCEKCVISVHKGGGGCAISPNLPATLQPNRGCSLDQYSSAKKLPVDFLSQLGVSQIWHSGKPSVRIPYFDENKVEVAVRFRIALNKDEVDNRFIWKRGTKPCLYGLWKLPTARKVGYIVIVEGESDAQTLWFHDIPAIGVPGANMWKEEWAEYFTGIPKIYLVIEPDSGGEACKRWLSNSKIANNTLIFSFSSYKDPSGLYLSDPERFNDNFQEFIDLAMKWDDFIQIEAQQIKHQSWDKCQGLANDDDILGTFYKEIQKSGVVGEEKVAKLLYLIVNSRWFQRPISASIKGPSSCGKSYLVEQVLKFFPSKAYYPITAMSEKALAYSTEPIKHRYLVIYEAAGIQGEFGSFLIRSLLSEGRLSYDTVEKTNQGLRPRHIEREGPTGLILTTTALHLHPENETRILSVPVTDTREHTKNIILSIAGNHSEKIDFSPWHALQDYFENSIHEVDIPFALFIAENINPVAPRLRRDFTQILNLIRSHAILYQAQRTVKDGKIIAQIDDYRIVRELINEIISEGLEVAISPTVRETVNAVKLIYQGGCEAITIKEIADKLNIDKSTALRRVKASIKAGFLQNLEDRKGQAANIIMGEPLPEDLAILPPPEFVLGCMVAGNSLETGAPPSPLERPEGNRDNTLTEIMSKE